jgi:hypothetical protein
VQVASGGNLQTGKDTLAWNQSQARAWDAICRHTALTALAQLRTAAIRAAITGAMNLPAAAAARENAAHAAGESTISADDLHFHLSGAPVPRPRRPALPAARCRSIGGGSRRRRRGRELTAAVRHGIASTAWVPKLFLMLAKTFDGGQPLRYHIELQRAVRERIERLELPTTSSLMELARPAVANRRELKYVNVSRTHAPTARRLRR